MPSKKEEVKRKKRKQKLKMSSSQMGNTLRWKKEDQKKTDCEKTKQNEEDYENQTMNIYRRIRRTTTTTTNLTLTNGNTKKKTKQRRTMYTTLLQPIFHIAMATDPSIATANALCGPAIQSALKLALYIARAVVITTRMI